ncbi:MAG: hypothetical protein AAB267_07805, partial [Candidatus Desantisbacteria bacterium]
AKNENTSWELEIAVSKTDTDLLKEAMAKVGSARNDAEKRNAIRELDILKQTITKNSEKILSGYTPTGKKAWVMKYNGQGSTVSHQGEEEEFKPLPWFPIMTESNIKDNLITQLFYWTGYDVYEPPPEIRKELFYNEANRKNKSGTSWEDRPDIPDVTSEWIVNAMAKLERLGIVPKQESIRRDSGANINGGGRELVLSKTGILPDLYKELRARYDWAGVRWAREYNFVETLRLNQDGTIKEKRNITTLDSQTQLSMVFMGIGDFYKQQGDLNNAKIQYGYARDLLMALPIKDGALLHGEFRADDGVEVADTEIYAYGNLKVALAYIELADRLTGNDREKAIENAGKLALSIASKLQNIQLGHISAVPSESSNKEWVSKEMKLLRDQALAHVVFSRLAALTGDTNGKYTYRDSAIKGWLNKIYDRNNNEFSISAGEDKKLSHTFIVALLGENGLTELFRGFGLNDADMRAKKLVGAYPQNVILPLQLDNFLTREPFLRHVVSEWFKTSKVSEKTIE